MRRLCPACRSSPKQPISSSDGSTIILAYLGQGRPRRLAVAVPRSQDCDCGRYLVFECKDELYSIAPELQYPRRPQLQHASGPNLVAITKDMAMYIDPLAGSPGWIQVGTMAVGLVGGSQAVERGVGMGTKGAIFCMFMVERVGCW